ncbi:MAG: Crp/Fnr family transcriptional regulator [Thermoleophilia bacterium]
MSTGALSRAAAEAWRASFLAELPRRVAASLLDAAAEVDVAAGSVVYRGTLPGEAAPLVLVVEGLLRVFVSSPQGRQATIRYATPGDVLGLPAVVAGGGPTGVQAVTECRLVRLPADRLRALAEEDAATSWAVARELADRVFENASLLSANVFLTVRQRVARHLLDLAEREGERLVVHASHQDVADAIGSVREVVSRVLSQLRREGLVDREGATLVLRDPAALHDASRPG